MGLLTLLAFFTFLQPRGMALDVVEAPQAMPLQAADAAAVQVKATVLLEIDAHGVVSGHFKKEDEKAFGNAAKIDTAALETWIKAHPDALENGVMLRVNGKAIQGRVIEVLNVLTKLKIDKVSFTTQEK